MNETTSDLGLTSNELLEMTTEIVSAYVSNATVEMSELPGLILEVHGALERTLGGAEQPEPAPLKPAVPIRKSVQPDHIVCLEDGNKLKMLKRYLRTQHNMTPDEYRVRWGLPSDYPMVAPNYSKARSDFAKRIGLGRRSDGS